MMKGCFVTGIGTGVGKTVVSAILCEALGGDYWKPIQSGFASGTDSQWVMERIENGTKRVHPEAYLFKTPMAPLGAARIEGREIEIDLIEAPRTSAPLIIEGAGGLFVPIRDDYFVIDLIEKLKVPVVLVTRSYLGSINHTLLSLEALKHRGIKVAAVVFSGGEFGDSETYLRSTLPENTVKIPEESNWSLKNVQEVASSCRQRLSALILGS